MASEPTAVLTIAFFTRTKQVGYFSHLSLKIAPELLFLWKNLI